MRNLIAAIYFLLAMFGCNGGGTTIVTRSVIDGVEAVHSRIRVTADVARFECIASASGECHYTLFRDECATPRDCATQPMERFAMATGASREIVGLPEFGACVTPDDVALTKDCKPRPQAR
ncbi:hypothetical protein ACFPN1_11335 [Lysobacter yangpyeongensis]|uniref:Lipoprotein n=1 Tax=Lysobacter yangpyeongensis TaxID=346182 RepID=A0ABW0SNN0_9GAMM